MNHFASSYPHQSHFLLLGCRLLSFWSALWAGLRVHISGMWAVARIWGGFGGELGPSFLDKGCRFNSGWPFGSGLSAHVGGVAGAAPGEQEDQQEEQENEGGEGRSGRRKSNYPNLTVVSNVTGNGHVFGPSAANSNP